MGRDIFSNSAPPPFQNPVSPTGQAVSGPDCTYTVWGFTYRTIPTLALTYYATVYQHSGGCGFESHCSSISISIDIYRMGLDST